MKLNKKSQEKLVKNLRNSNNHVFQTINSYIDKMEEISITNKDGVELIMQLKMKLLMYMLRNLFLSSSHCYFCIDIDPQNCLKCRYAKYNGICDSSDSTYKRIQNKRLELTDLIFEHYAKF